MNILQRIHREPAKLLAFVTAVLAGVTLAGLLTATGAGVVLGIVSAAVGLLSYFVTPASEVVAQQIPGQVGIRAGAAARIETGTHVKVEAIE